MPLQKNPPPVSAVAFTMATRTASYGNTKSNALSSAPSLDPTPTPTPNPTLNLTYDPSLNYSHDPTPDPTLDIDISNGTTAAKAKKLHLVWTDEMEEMLFNELLGQDCLGKRANMGFKSNAWMVVKDAIQEIYTGPLVIEMQQIKSKESNYKVLYVTAWACFAIAHVALCHMTTRLAWRPLF
jgi:hypothetical protein